MTNRQEHISPDGQWRWDGSQWVPNQAEIPPPPSNAPRSGMSSGRAFLVTVAAILVSLLVVMLVAGAVGENNRQDELRDDLNELTCQYDPEYC